MRELQLGVVQEAQREIGRLWQENRISIAQEHMATAISQLALAHLYQQAAPSLRNDRRVVVACVEGELHDFPARLVADCLDLAGYDVRFLGANVPLDSLLPLLLERPPDLVALSITMTFHVPALRRAVEAIREALPEQKIAVGGHACVWSPGLAQELQVDVSAADAWALVQASNGLFGLETA